MRNSAARAAMLVLVSSLSLGAAQRMPPNSTVVDVVAL
jgi:hypothetical protein